MLYFVIFIEHWKPKLKPKMRYVWSLDSKLKSSHGPIEVVQLKPHLRDQVLHATDRVNDFYCLRVGIVPHLHWPREVLDHPTPESFA